MTAPEQTPPSARQLIRSTLIAAAVAALLLVTCVLPAEYGIDPTGIGRVLGLTQMGEIKVAIAEEAAAKAEAEAAADSVLRAQEAEAQSSNSPSVLAAGGTDEPTTQRTDTVYVMLQPGASAEVKLQMESGASAQYQWVTTSGVVNFELHGDSTNAPKGWFVSYKKGQGVAKDAGELVAGFRGDHGWFWRNRGTAPVEIRLETSGMYGGLTRPE